MCVCVWGGGGSHLPVGWRYSFLKKMFILSISENCEERCVCVCGRCVKGVWAVCGGCVEGVRDYTHTPGH